MAKREVEQWITINGVHVPVFKGESKADAAKNFKAKSGKRNANQPITQKGKANAKKEYTNARNAAHNASEDKKEKADARFDKAKQKYTEAKEKKVIKSAARTGDKAQRSGVYKEQLKDVQDDIKQFESTPERLRSADYEKKLAELKKKEASLKGYIDRDKPTQAGKNDDIIQEIRYKGEISRKDENGEWKVVGHYDNKKSDVSEEKLRSYGYDPHDSTGDPTVIQSDKGDFYKIGDNKWNEHSKSGKALGGTYTDKQIADKLKDAKQVKVLPSEKKQQDSQINKDLDEKEKQIARNKAEAEQANGKLKEKEVIRAAADVAKVAMKYKMDAGELSKIAEGDPRKAEIIARNTSAFVKRHAEMAGGKDNGKSEYIVSKNISGQELKIPRKTYEQRLERAEKYKQELVDMANRPHSRYKLNPNDVRKAEEEIKRLRKILQSGRD